MNETPAMKVLEVVSTTGDRRMRLVSRRCHPDQPGIVSWGASIRASAPEDNSAADFKRRVLDRRVDLVKHFQEGVPPIDYLPASDGMLIRGKRHLIPGPKKSGKSISMLVHWVKMAAIGAKVVIFDRENGADEYARRLYSILVAANLKDVQRKRVQKNLHYYAFPRFKPSDAPHLVKLAMSADVVVYDATRMFMTDLGLQENSADDYSQFMASLVDPLAEANVATVVLDNTGHENQGRARATAAKGDLNEVLFTFEKVEQFNLDHQGKVRLKIADSRFGNEGEWEMLIGGGAYGGWKRSGEERPIPPEFVRAAENALQPTGREGLSQTKLLEAIRAGGARFRAANGRGWLYRLRADPNSRIDAISGDEPRGQMTFYCFSGGPPTDG